MNLNKNIKLQVTFKYDYSSHFINFFKKREIKEKRELRLKKLNKIIENENK